MKKFIFALMVLAAPMVASAQGLFAAKTITAQKAPAEYMKGAVPMQNGKVVFTKTVDLKGRAADEAFTRIAQWANLRYTANTSRSKWDAPDYFNNLEYAAIRVADRQGGRISCQGAEDIVFKNKPLAKDFTNIYYILNIDIHDGKADVTMQTISYIYVGDHSNERLTAEEWITDEIAFNKKGELRRVFGKFRVKTIDLFEQICKEISESL